MRWRQAGITLVNARVIGEAGRVASTVRVRGDRVDGLDVAPARDDLVVDLDGAVVTPGLVNAHDHLELNSFPRLKWRERYDNAGEWIADFQPRFTRDPCLAPANPETLEDRLWVGGLKNLLSGVTTVCHHNPLHRSLRRPFPVRVVRNYRISHSLLIDGPQVAESYRRTPSEWPWIIHAAEGVDGAAAREIELLDQLGCLGANTVLVHGVAICAERGRQLASRGVSLIWCPTSNAFLFAACADVRAFDDAGRLALGSDSRLSGEGDLLDEVRAAAATHQVSAEGVVRMVTSGAADVLRLTGAGRLRARAPADLAVIRPLANDAYDTIAGACRTDVTLVMVGGQAALAAPELADVFTHLGVERTEVMVDGQPRVMARWLARRARRLRLAEPGLEVAAC
ncbi:MAG: amidohydrolase family protein [Vicinamibacterales bacterium]